MVIDVVSLTKREETAAVRVSLEECRRSSRMYNDDVAVVHEEEKLAGRNTVRSRNI